MVDHSTSTTHWHFRYAGTDENGVALPTIFDVLHHATDELHRLAHVEFDAIKEHGLQMRYRDAFQAFTAWQKLTEDTACASGIYARWSSGRLVPPTDQLLRDAQAFVEQINAYVLSGVEAWECPDDCTLAPARMRLAEAISEAGRYRLQGHPGAQGMALLVGLAVDKWGFPLTDEERELVTHHVTPPAAGMDDIVSLEASLEALDNLSDRAVEWLNITIAPNSWEFGWRWGEFYLNPTEWWEGDGH